MSGFTRIRKKPVEVEAIQVIDANLQHLLHLEETDPERRLHITLDARDGSIIKIRVQTLEGSTVAVPDNWIIRGVNGELYPIQDDILRQTYDFVERVVS